MFGHCFLRADRGAGCRGSIREDLARQVGHGGRVASARPRKTSDCLGATFIKAK